jgi:hypothetical protein
MPLDVVGPNLSPTPDGIVVGGDALAIINFINSFGAGTIFRPGIAFTGYLDTVDNLGNPVGNNSVDPNDALAVINRINAFGTNNPGPEGEGGGSTGGGSAGGSGGAEGEASADSFFWDLGGFAEAVPETTTAVVTPAAAQDTMDDLIALLAGDTAEELTKRKKL